MLTHSAKGRRLLVAAVTFAVGASLLGSVPAEARSKWAKRAAKKVSCTGSTTLVRIDNKTCPATKFRPPLVVSRACCENKKHKTHCKGYQPCPARSPS